VLPLSLLAAQNVSALAQVAVGAWAVELEFVLAEPVSTRKGEVLPILLVLHRNLGDLHLSSSWESPCSMVQAHPVRQGLQERCWIRPKVRRCLPMVVYLHLPLPTVLPLPLLLPMVDCLPIVVCRANGRLYHVHVHVRHASRASAVASRHR
jgi:hypothetical protein